MKRIFSSSFGIEGNGLFRFIRLYCISRIVPIGHLGSGPGPRCLLVLTFLHYFARPGFWLLARKEDTIRRLYGKIKGRA